MLERPSTFLGDFSPGLAPTATTAYEIFAGSSQLDRPRCIGRAIHLHRSVARIARDREPKRLTCKSRNRCIRRSARLTSSINRFQ